MSNLVLFHEDWDSSDAIVHYNTKNETFLEYANLLKSMGVKNYKWCLQLHNPDLLHLDPFSTDLTQEEMLAIRAECAVNPFYYFREIARAPGHTNENPKVLQANRGNMSSLWLFINHITFYLIQIRQTGKSLFMDHNAIYLNNLHYSKKLINLFTKDDGLRKTNLERIRELEQYLPWYLSGHKKGDVNNTEEIHYGLTGNRFKAHVPATSEKFANGVGRGFTAPTYQIDEFAFLRYVETSVPAMLAGGNNARSEAAADGIFYGTIFATTAGKKDDPDGAYAYSQVMAAADWSEAYLDAKNLNDLKRIILAAMPSGAIFPEVHCAFNHRQLGKTDEWLRQAMSAAKSTGEAADRDFGNRWTDGTQSSPLSTADTRRVRASEKIYFGEITDPWPYTMRWQMPLNQIDQYMAGNKVIMSLDPSENIGRDDSTLNLRDVKTGRVVAAAQINEANTIDMAKFIVHLLVKFPGITWIPENKLNGSTIIDYVIIELVGRNIDPFKRIFNTIVDDAMEFKDRYKNIVTNGRIPKEYITEYRKHFGFKTSSGGKFSRDGLYGSVFMAAIKYTGDYIHDPVTIAQILGLTVREGRIDHPKGGKDDAVVAWLLTYWFLTSAKNLSHYGIDPREVLSVNSSIKEEMTDEKMYERYYQTRIRDQITEIIEQLAKEKDSSIAARLEARLLHAESMLSETDKATLAVDDLIQRLRQERKRAMRKY